MSPDDQLKAAMATLAGLEAERDRIAGRLGAIEIERQAVAHAALTGDHAARETLTALKREAADLADSATDVRSAIAQAERDVAAAESAVAVLAGKDRAKRQIALAEELEAEGAAATKALASFIAAYRGIEDVAVRLNAEGVRHLSGELVRVNMVRAIQTELAGAKLNTAAIAPRDRTDLAQLVTTWAAGIKDGAKLVINGRSRKAAPPAPAPQGARTEQAQPPPRADDEETAAMQAEISGAKTLGALARAAA